MKKKLSTLTLGCALATLAALFLADCTDLDLAKFTVKFNMDGGIPAVKDKIVKAGNLLAQPKPDPTKEGHTFAGWHKDEGLSQAFNFNSDKVTAHTTLYAKWSINTYRVTFNFNNETAASSLSVEYGSTLYTPDPPTKAYHTFEGWYKDQGLTQVFDFATEKITAEIMLYAKWVPESTTTTYTVTFNLNGGTPVVADKTVKENELLTKPFPDPTKLGNAFEGWYKDAGLTQAFNFSTEKITADIMLYAKWTPESTTTTYTVAFNLNGGTPNQDDKTVEDGKLLEKPSPDPTKTGHTFEGWYKDAGLTQAFNFSTEKITAEIMLYAKWTPESTTTTYTVAFNLNGGTPNQDDKTVEDGKLLEKPSPDPTKTGYTFEGWYKDVGLTQAFNFSTEKITADITLYAKWDAVAYTVTFNYNDGGTNADLQRKVNYGEKVNDPNPTRTGYTFENWYSDTALTTAFDITTGTITQDITLYAKWESNLVGIPDANFRTKLKALIPGAFVGDSLDSKNAQVTSRTTLDVSRSNIRDLTGIEYFTALTELNCFSNQLTSLDVSKNTALTELLCLFNQLGSLDISTNTALTVLACGNNQLDELDVSTNTALDRLICNYNQLESLDVSTNTALTLFSCNKNKLTGLDVSANTALTNLNCGDNDIDELDVSTNTALIELNCPNDSLAELDVSANTVLEALNCGGNSLTKLDVTTNTVLKKLSCMNNQLDSLNLSTNTLLTQLNCEDNQLDSLDISTNTALNWLSCGKNLLKRLDIRGMRNATFLAIRKSNDETNMIGTLKIHENIKNLQAIKVEKTARGNGVKIETYSAAAGSTSYTAVCNDYDPTETNEQDRCKDTP